MNNMTQYIVLLSIFLVSCASQPQQETADDSRAEEKYQPLLVWQEDTDEKSKQEQQFIEQLLPAEPELRREESRFDVSAKKYTD